MKRRTKFTLLGALGLVVVTPVALFLLAVIFLRQNDSGSPDLAAEWRQRLAGYATPEQASVEPRVEVLRFEDGSWVFGLTRNSHGGRFNGGGTVVVKDSTGALRTFHGHVCGRALHFFDEAQNLAEFYNQMSKNDFTEGIDGR